MMNPPTKNTLRIGLSVATIAAIGFRHPGLFVDPRFWAEEGAVYYAFALSHPWYRALLDVHFGYFALWPNLATIVAAHAATLFIAPLVTTLFALAAQLFPIYVLLWGESSLWKHPAKIIASVLIVLFTPLSNEVWLNTINSQFYFAVTTFLVLLIDIDSRPAMKWSSRILLAVGGLTGPASCILAPLFFLKGRWDSQRERTIQAAILAGCIVVQLLAFVVSSTQNSSPARTMLFNVPLLASILWTQSVSLLFFGPNVATFFGQLIDVGHAHESTFWLIGLFLLVVEAVFFYFASSRLSRTQRMVLLGSYLLFVGLSTIGGLGTEEEKYLMLFTGIGGRYFFASNVVFMFLLLANAGWEGTTINKVRSAACIGLLCLALVLGIEQYQTPMLYTDTGPSWKEQVVLWQSDTSRTLAIWPAGWELKIPANHR